MALTKEQIRSLKPGDKLIIPGTFCRVDNGGAIWANIDGDYFYFSPSYVSLPGEPEEKPKYDPCRRFRKGDEVRVVERCGRSLPLCYDERGVMTVTEDEEALFVSVRQKGAAEETVFPWFYLELVSPVEERRPYEVVETMSLGGWQIMRDGLPLVLYDGQLHPDAKAAAEAECKRLNDEWQTKVCRSEEGKEENNG